MIEISEDNHKQYIARGWCIAKLNISDEKTKIYTKALEELVLKAKEEKYPLGRVYHDYLTSFNLAAVEAPLNKKICNLETYDFFNKIKLGNSIKKLKKWNNLSCSLIRLFCMNNYNYSGHWHVDTSAQSNDVQVSICLKNENGFKIIKKQYKKEIESFLNIKTLDDIEKFILPLKLSKKYYDMIELKKGEILFFEPSLLHKGCTFDERLQFHMRFEEVNKSLNFDDYYEVKDIDFMFAKKLNFDLEISKINLNFANVKRSKILSRLKKTLNYYLPIFNLYSYYIQKKKFSKVKEIDFSILSNTLFQKNE
tara:strand:+ start:501 stop:1427 length:927 start_codon:yes stop_codon:yes gene_type:complete